MKKLFWPQPTTPLRGDVAEINFKLYHRAQRGTAPAAVQKLFDSLGAYRCKPKRNSRGVIWNGRAYWWSFKGYYRPGLSSGLRRPVQHYIWEHHHRRKMPRLHEIWFRDRDHNNFEIENLEMIHKSELRRRTIALGETRRPTFEERSAGRGRWACRMSRERTEILLGNFQSKPKKGKNNGHTETLGFLGKRKQVITHGFAKRAA
jgi:hypothetical protein